MKARVIVADPPWKFGDSLPGPKRGALARVFSKIRIENGCWVWTASLTVRGGYAQANIGGRVVRVHRWLYEQLVAPVPMRLDLDHVCRQRRCVNPAHLEPVTRAENLRRGIGNKPKMVCLRGHLVAGTNVYVRPGSGRRECLACKRARAKR
jgi:hypothetical protein